MCININLIYLNFLNFKRVAIIHNYIIYNKRTMNFYYDVRLEAIAGKVV